MPVSLMLILDKTVLSSDKFNGYCIETAAKTKRAQSRPFGLFIIRLLLHFCLPQPMQITVGVDGQGLVVYQGKFQLRGLADVQVFALAAALGLDIDEHDIMHVFHRMGNAADLDLDAVAGHGHGG